jgi:hypothetical protein
MNNHHGETRRPVVALVALTAAAALTAAMALPAQPASASSVALAKRATIVETTPLGYQMVLKLKGDHGKLRMSCPDGTRLGSDRFTLDDKRKFTAVNGNWKFKGVVDAANHFKGHGKPKGAKCGAGVTKRIYEPVPRRVLWTVCPNDDVLAPMAAGTPFTYQGVLGGASQGTQLRIEYTDPGPAITVAVNVTTDSAGHFSNTHAFPSNNGGEYAADAMARFPASSLSPGVACGVFIQ